MHQNQSRGFTLVELALVLSIIGLLAAALFVGGGALMASAEKKALVKQLADIRSAAAQFKERFLFLPGDFPAAAEIPNLSAACKTGGAGVGDGNGLIEFAASPSESSCANEHLFKSGFYPHDTFRTDKATIRLMSRAAAITRYTAVIAAPVNNVRETVRNLILLEEVKCSLASAVDEAFDDNVLNNDTGLAASLGGSCTGDNRVWLVLAL